IAAAILGLAPVNPRWGGHAATILCNLRPVGGEAASFFGAETLQQAIELILADASARASVVVVRLSTAERATNANGYARFLVEKDGSRSAISYGSQYAVSLLRSGSEKGFDHEQ